MADDTFDTGAAVETPILATDRDTRGRFVAGNTTGRLGGAPRHRRGKLVRSLRAAVGDAQLADVWSALYANAMSGDTAAAGLLLSYALGRPREADPEFAPIAGIDLTSTEGLSSVAARIGAAAADGSMPLAAAERLLGVATKCAEFGVLRELEARLRKVEGVDA